MSHGDSERPSTLIIPDTTVEFAVAESLASLTVALAPSGLTETCLRALIRDLSAARSPIDVVCALFASVLEPLGADGALLFLLDESAQIVAAVSAGSIALDIGLALEHEANRLPLTDISTESTRIFVLRSGEMAVALLAPATKPPLIVTPDSRPVFDAAICLAADALARLGALDRAASAENALSHREEWYRAAAHGSFDAFFILRSVRNESNEIIDFEFMDLNHRGESLLGFTRDQLIGQRLCEVLPMNRTSGFFDKYRKVVESGTALEEEFGNCAAGHTSIWIYQQVVPLADGIAITTREMTERKRAEVALRESQERLRLALDAGKCGTWDWDIDTDLITWSDRIYEIHGLSPGQFDGTLEAYSNLIHPDDRERIGDAISQALRDRVPYTTELRVIQPSGEVRWIVTNGRVIFADDGRPVRMLGAAIDITEGRRVQQERDSHLAEIEVLNERLQRAMTETHHRVKNNLQVMAAMVDMQVMEGKDAVPTTELHRLGTHIRTLAAVHELLTERAKHGAHSDTVSARDLLMKLLPRLKGTAGQAELQFAVEDARLTSRQGTSLAMIANELVGNAIKHGDRLIEVRFEVTQDSASLQVSDDGPGFPPGFDSTSQANTGLDLVDSLSRWDLGGEVEYANREEGGGRVTVRFPVPLI